MNRAEYRRQMLANEPEELKLQRIKRRYENLIMALLRAVPAKKKPSLLVLAGMQKEWLRINARQAYREGAQFATEVYCDFIKKEGMDNA